MKTVREWLDSARERLNQAGVEDAGREAIWLLAHLMGTSAGTVRMRQAQPMPAELVEPFQALVERRAAREPIQYILGTAEFLGMPLRVTPAVLIPRLDTETLVQEAISRLPAGAHVADVGTGSGAIAIGVATLLPTAQVVAVDISGDALAVARENAATHGVTDRIQFRQGDLLAPLAREVYDAILSNPPYIGEEEMAGLMPEVRSYEPHLALSPGVDSLRFYRRLAADAPSLLKIGGFLAVEVGISQAVDVRLLFVQAGLDVTVCCDTAGVERVVIGRRTE